MSCDQKVNHCACSCAFQPQPIIMPTQVITNKKVTCVEQPIIFPVECRTVNRVVLVPRYYRAIVNNGCCQNNGCNICQ